MSAEELQLQKLTREVEKLQLDIDNLRRPVLAYWRNPASYLTALTVIIGVAAYAGQSYVNDAKSERAKAELMLAELKTKTIEDDILILEGKQRKLAADKSQLEQDTKLRWSEYGEAIAEYEKAVAELTVKQSELDDITKRLESGQEQLVTQGQQNQILTAAISDAKKLDLQVAKSASVLSARLYIQVGTALEAKEAQQLREQLRSGDLAVPDVEVVGDKVNGLKATELRYFWDADSTEAEALAKRIQATGNYGTVALALPAHLKGKTRPRHFELWIKRPTP